jgi:hypothetical protein
MPRKNPLTTLCLASVLLIPAAALADGPQAAPVTPASPVAPATPVTPAAAGSADAPVTAPPASADAPAPTDAASVPLPAPSAPDGEPAQVAPPAPAAPAPPAPHVRLFLQEYVAYDASTGEATRGQSKTPMSREELYRLLGRPDLVDTADAHRTQRTVLFVGAGAAIVGGIVAGLALRSNIPEMNSGYCTSSVRVFNDECDPQMRKYEVLSAVAMISGALAGGGLIAWGTSISTDGAPRTAIAGMVASYNGNLMHRLRESGTTTRTAGSGARLDVMPNVGPGGGSVQARLTF